jgi:hypothetical protein
MSGLGGLPGPLLLLLLFVVLLLGARLAEMGRCLRKGIAKFGRGLEFVPEKRLAAWMAASGGLIVLTGLLWAARLASQ